MKRFGPLSLTTCLILSTGCSEPPKPTKAEDLDKIQKAEDVDPRLTEHLGRAGRCRENAKAEHAQNGPR